MSCEVEGSGPGQSNLREAPLSIKEAESHRAGSPAGTTSGLFASGEPLERDFIWCSWKLEGTKRQGVGGGARACPRGQWRGEGMWQGRHPVCGGGWSRLQPQAAAPTWGGRATWLLRGRVWLHSLRGRHKAPSSAPPPPTPGLLRCTPQCPYCTLQVAGSPPKPEPPLSQPLGS